MTELAPWLESSWSALRLRLERDALPHALLLLGPRGVGKTALANKLCRAVLCAEQIEGCGRCSNCGWVEAGTHPDLYRCEPEADSNVIKVDQIRALSAKATLTSSRGHQVFVVNPADRMNQNAANALLKTLEEPSPGAVLVLIAENRSRLPATVVSRCQQLLMKVPDQQTTISWMLDSYSFEAEQVHSALTAAGGSPGLAIDYLQANLLEIIDVTAADLAQLAKGDQQPIVVASTWSDDALAERLEWLSRWLVALATGKTKSLPQSLISLLLQAEPKSLIMLADHVGFGRRLLETPARAELVVEDLLIEWQNLFAASR